MVGLLIIITIFFSLKKNYPIFLYKQVGPYQMPQPQHCGVSSGSALFYLSPLMDKGLLLLMFDVQIGLVRPKM